jgi:oxaloacetate decarboxylase (Na+ extruding) subunit alpha
MVTPLSQFVGSQAVLNLVAGERYGTVTDEIIGYALGRWGSEAPEAMDPDVRARILDRPRAAEVQGQTPEEPTLDEVRQRYATGMSDEELIARVFAGVGNAPLGWNGGRRVPHSYQEWEARNSSLARVLERLAASPARRFTVAFPDAGIRVTGAR